MKNQYNNSLQNLYNDHGELTQIKSELLKELENKNLTNSEKLEKNQSLNEIESSMKKIEKILKKYDK